MSNLLSRLVGAEEKSLFLAVVLVIVVGPASSQEGANATHRVGDKKSAYDVVSIRPCQTGARQVQQTPDGFTARCAELWTLMYYAYPGITMGDQIVGFPAWARSTAFEVDAKMDDASAASLRSLTSDKQAEERRLMLRSILADRFQLRAHYGFKESSAYQLVISKGGPKLTESKPGAGAEMEAMRSGRIDVRGRPMEALAEVLTHALGRPVVDKTGLTGKYDVTLTYTPDELIAAESNAPSIYTALQEQLGLKLVRANTQVKTIVVEHVEQPSPN